MAVFLITVIITPNVSLNQFTFFNSKNEAYCCFLFSFWFKHRKILCCFVKAGIDNPQIYLLFVNCTNKASPSKILLKSNYFDLLHLLYIFLIGKFHLNLIWQFIYVNEDAQFSLKLSGFTLEENRLVWETKFLRMSLKYVLKYVLHLDVNSMDPVFVG